MLIIHLISMYMSQNNLEEHDINAGLNLITTTVLRPHNTTIIKIA